MIKLTTLTTLPKSYLLPYIDLLYKNGISERISKSRTCSKFTQIQDFLRIFTQDPGI